MRVTNDSKQSPILDDEEQILEWNKDLPNPEPSCVHNLIEHNSHAQPNAPAICAWDGKFSYSELETYASLLAQRLVQLGVERGQFVPLCFEKSAFAVISLFAVLKAGAACVLLDPAHPIGRLQSMVDDIKANLLLCSPDVRPQFRQKAFSDLSILEITEEHLKDIPTSNARLPNIQPENAAIGLFTSGSTGKPKGIIQHHSTAAFSAQTCSRVFGINSDSRVLQWAAYCFDMSVIDMLMTLVGGGCICIPSEQDKTDNLVQTMRDMKVDLATMTPSFAQTIKSEGVDSLKTLVFGGEPVSKDHLTGWPEGIRIINAYGPAEGSVCVAGNADPECPANVGRAVGSVTWIVDESDPSRLVPIGSMGELLTEGPLLARGYLNDPQNTAASFLEDLPWLIRARGAKSIKRVYKTGDLARYGEGGSIILMGRKDTQIKLRGQRIEAAEVEHTISSVLPAGFTVIVDVISPAMRPESQLLVAFIGQGAKTGHDSDEELLTIDNVPKKSLAPDLRAMEGGLKETLPKYMVPSYFITLRYIPATSSGKVDRKRLKHIGVNAATTKTIYAPDGPLNGKSEPDRGSGILLKDVAELWQSTLGLKTRPIDPSSNFFGLGGDSIAAMKLVTMARNACLALTTKQVFEKPTLAAMASVVKPIRSSVDGLNGYGNSHQTTMFAHNSSLKDVFSPNHTLSGLEVEETEEAPDMQAFMVVSGLLRSHGYINYFAFDLKGEINTNRLEAACKILVEHHSVLRTVFGIRAGRVLQIVLKSYTPEFRRHSSQSSTEDVLSQVCETERRCCTGFGDQLVRFLLVERGPADGTLIMRISHAQFDGTSLGLIYSGLQKAYDGHILDPGPQFTDFSRVVKEENNVDAEAFWCDLLQGSSMTSIVDHSKPCYANVINNKIFFTFPFTSIEQTDITLATVVKAAWALVLAEMASTKDVVFGYAVTGREIPLKGVENVVGDCNNAALARVTIRENDTALELLRRIQAQYIDAIPYQSMGLRQMVEQCTDWPRWTRYSTSINHQNYTDAGLDIFRIGDATCTVSYKDFEVDRRDVQVYSWPPKDGQMKIAMAFCDKIVPLELAEKMLKALGENIECLSLDVKAPLVIASDSFCGIPLQVPSSLDDNAVGDLPRPYHFGFSLLDPEAIVSNVWNRFLVDYSKDLLENFVVTDDLPFYSFAGDIVYAAQMSAFYEQEGLRFSMELLIENATKRSQKRLLELMLK